MSVHASGMLPRQQGTLCRQLPPRMLCRLLCTATASDGGLLGAMEKQAEASARPPRFYVTQPLPPSLAEGQLLPLPPEEARHALKVLRLKEGDLIELCDLRGGLVSGRLQPGVSTLTPTGVSTLHPPTPSPAPGGRRRSGGAGGPSSPPSSFPPASSSSSAAKTMMVSADGPPTVVPWRGPRWELVVACGGLKGGRADWLVEKATELGAAALWPLLTQRSASVGSSNKYKSGKKRAVEDDDEDEGAGGGRQARWERLAVSAAKQSLRVHGMQVMRPITIEELAALTPSAGTALVAAAGGVPVARALQQQQQQQRSSSSSMPSAAAAASGDMAPAPPPPAAAGLAAAAAGTRGAEGAEGGSPAGAAAGSTAAAGNRCGGGLLAVGPEGDFTAEELRLLVAAGFSPVGLGPNRLRVETAALALLAAAVALGCEVQ